VKNIDIPRIRKRISKLKIQKTRQLHEL